MIRGAVIGLGYMGMHHLRNLHRLMVEDGLVELVAGVDIDPGKERICRQYNTRFYRDYNLMLDREEPDFVSIVVPTSLHHKVSMDIIDRGISFLVEKPLADTLDASIEIAKAAERGGVKASVGHIERFNPAVMKLLELIRRGEIGDIVYMSSIRIGRPRFIDTGVIIDLATHDIDVMMNISGLRVSRVYSTTLVKLPGSSTEDHAEIILDFDGGVIGHVRASRLSPVKYRMLYVMGMRKYVELNYTSQSLYMYEGLLDTSRPTWESYREYLSTFKTRRMEVEVEGEEPLYIELRSFIDYLYRGGRPPVSLWDGVDVLRVAYASIDSYRSGKPVELSTTPR